MKKLFYVIVFVMILICGLVLFWLPGKYTVPIIMYHHVAKIDKAEPNWVSPENFEYQMAFLKKHGFRVISLDQLADAIKSKRRVSRKSVVLTFDDGYEDNYTHAYPILKKYGFTATIFLISGAVDQEKFLTTKQALQMHTDHISFGSHTRTHVYLPSESRERQADEIVNSKKILEKKLGFSMASFSYPNGGFSEDIKSIVKLAGYKEACVTNRGYNRLNKDVYELHRVRFSDQDIRQDYLWAKLSGYYNLFRKSKSPY